MHADQYVHEWDIKSNELTRPASWKEDRTGPRLFTRVGYGSGDVM